MAGNGKKASGSRVTFRRNAKTGNLWATELLAFEGMLWRIGMAAIALMELDLP